jgi:hypothetical protein
VIVDESAGLFFVRPNREEVRRVDRWAEQLSVDGIEVDEVTDWVSLSTKRHKHETQRVLSRWNHVVGHAAEP